MDCILPGSSVHGIFEARVLEWVAISFSRGSSQCRDWTRVSCIAGRHLTVWGILRKHPTNKAIGGDGITAELFQNLKDDAMKMLHSIRQRIWKTQQWPQEWKSSFFILISKKGNAKESSNHYTIALISHASNWRWKWQPTPVFLPWESRGGGAWWAAVYGVTQSRTQLKWLSSSSSSSTC